MVKPNFHVWKKKTYGKQTKKKPFRIFIETACSANDDEKFINHETSCRYKTPFPIQWAYRCDVYKINKLVNKN